MQIPKQALIAKHIGTATKLKKSAPKTPKVACVQGIGTTSYVNFSAANSGNLQPVGTTFIVPCIFLKYKPEKGGTKAREVRRWEHAGNRIDRGEVVPGMYRLLSRCTLHPIFSIVVSMLTEVSIKLSFYRIIFSSVLPWCDSMSQALSDITSVCLMRTECTSHKANRCTVETVLFFFSKFYFRASTHSGHTSKLHFFDCFPIVARVLYAIMSHIGAASSPLFFHPTISILLFLLDLASCTKRSTHNFHCFPMV